jgi:superfamily I DNA/RNA helicase
MILCRCKYQIKRWINWLSSQQVVWHNPYREKELYWNPTKTKSWKAMQVYHKLVTGKFVTITELKKLSELTISKSNMKHKAKTYLNNRVDDGEKVDIFSMEYYGFEEEFLSPEKRITNKLRLTGKAAELIVMDEAIVKKKPQVVIGTIHSVKGGETDHVWVDCSLSCQIGKNMKVSMDSYNDELRIKYVACTRARHTLGLMNEGGQI